MTHPSTLPLCRKEGDPHPNPAPLQGGVSSIPGPCFIFFFPQGGEHPSTHPLSKEAALLTCKAAPLTPAPVREGGCPGSTQSPWSMEGAPQHSVPSQKARPPPPPRCPIPSTYLVLEDRKASLINP